MQDLSKLAEGSLGTRVGSMSATNTISIRPDFSPPGSVSEGSDDLGAYSAPVELDPVGSVSDSGDSKPGTDGKPQASGQQGYHPGPPAWKPTTVPDVVRET